ncbi:MAG: glycosyltransferase [Candidatus Marinimicrobia bacterium]|nr:glycosyltransferase [Candidatus Neomarinimicrobiota bacterium]
MQVPYQGLLVSIVIPTYNRAYCLDRAVQSVLNQTYSKWELIIIDNHSSDNTDALVNGYQDSRIILYKIHNNGIIAASRNMGIMKAKGELLAFLDSDDWWVENKLQSSVNKINSGADLVYHDLIISSKLNESSLFYKTFMTNKFIKTRQVEFPVYEDLLYFGNAITTSSVVVKKDKLKLVGGFSEDESLISAEDYDLWLRISKNSDCKFERICQPLGYYWIGEENSTSADGNIKTLREILHQHNINNKIPGWACYVLGRSYYKIGNTSLSRKYLSMAIYKDNSWTVRIKALITLFFNIFQQKVKF